MSATSDYETSDDRTLPTVVYALYLLGLVNGLTVLIGLIIAYANRNGSSSRAQSHYIFQIRTFWLAVVWWIVGGLCMMWGMMWGWIPIIGLVGIPFVILGGLVFAVTHVWFALRAIIGLVYVSRGEAHPRPRTWLA